MSGEKQLNAQLGQSSFVNSSIDLNGPPSLVPGQDLTPSSPNSLVATRPVSPCSPPIGHTFMRNAPMIHGSPLRRLDFTAAKTSKNIDGVSFVALLDHVVESKRFAEEQKSNKSKKDNTVSGLIHAIHTTRPRPSSLEPSSNDDESVNQTSRPRKRRKTGKDSKTTEPRKKHHVAVGGKVAQVLEDIAKVPAKYTNLLMDKMT